MTFLVENFESLLKIFNILKSSVQSIQNPAFLGGYLYFKYICVLIIMSWPCPKCTFIFVYTIFNLKVCKINNSSGASAESKFLSAIFQSGDGRSPEKRPYDVPRGQNRYVMFPLLFESLLTHIVPLEVQQWCFCTSL